MKILIVYIATQQYNELAYKFFETLPLFCNNISKKVVYFTDKDDLDIKLNHESIESINYVKIRHQPWPLVTLMKFHYIKEAIENYGDECTHVVYFNANIEFLKRIAHSDYFQRDGLTAVYHWAWTRSNYNFVSLGHNDYKSKAFIGEPYKYVQACQVAGSIELVLNMCDKINHWIQVDLTKNIIPRWHDESYYNRYIHEANKCGIVKYLPEYNYNLSQGNYSDYVKGYIHMRSKSELEKLKDTNYVTEA